jgi:hypothetical protein
LHREDWPQQNVIRLTCDQIRKRWKCSHETASNTLKQLEECGWIARVGSAPGPSGQAGGVYELLMLDGARQPRKGPFIHWRPKVRVSAPACSN